MNIFKSTCNIIKDHKKKSNQVKRLQKKLKNIKKGNTLIPISVLQSMLSREKNTKLDYLDFYSWGEFHDDSYAREDSKRESRIELLEELIRIAKK